MKKAVKITRDKNKSVTSQIKQQITRMQAEIDKELAREQIESQARKLQSIAVCILPTLLQNAEAKKSAKEIVKFSVELAKSLVEETERAVKK